MAREPKEYRRLPGRARKHFAFFKNERCSLWLGRDHLLHITRQNYSETDKRFYLKDIQALNICRTSGGRIVNYVLGGCLAGFMLLALSVGVSLGWTGGLVLGIVPAFLLVGLLINTAFGPTCTCHLYTAVQIERLPSLGRLRTAHKTVALLKPFIEAAQGRLTPEDIEAHTDEQTDVQASSHALERDARRTRDAGPVRHESGSVHSVLFFLFLPLAASNAADIFRRDTWLMVFQGLSYLFVFTFLVTALIRQRNSDLPLNLRAITWVALGALLADFLFGTLVRAGYEFVHAMGNPNYFPSFYFGSNDVPLGWPPFNYYLLAVTMTHTAVALVGLLVFRDFQRERDTQAAGKPPASQPPEEH